MLRQGSATGLGGGGDLHVRMHFLSRMRERHPEGALPELRWRTRRASAPTVGTAGKVPSIDAAGVEAGRVCARELKGIKRSNRMTATVFRRAADLHPQGNRIARQHLRIKSIGLPIFQRSAQIR